MKLLNRKQLPKFGILTNIKVNNEHLLSALERSDLLNFENYNDIDVTQNGRYANFTITNDFCKRSFFTADRSLKGEEYRQLYLTDPEDHIAGLIATENYSTMYSRTKRLDPDNQNYDPLADELNYGKRNQNCIQEISEILDIFSTYDKVTRVRLAWLKSGYSIKPHIDYDPSYITRYHIPLITNDKCKLNAIVKGVTYSTNFKADGNIYFLNTGHVHWASNDSHESRLHLIIDVHGQKLLENLTEYI